MAKHDQSFYETKSVKLLKYNAMDCANTARIYQHLLKESRWEEERTRNLYRVHVQLSKLCAEMHTNGLYVHRGNKAFLEWGLMQEYEEKERKFLKRCDIPEMRCNANDLRALIYKRHATAKIARFNLPDPYDPKMYTDETLEKISVDGTSLRLLVAEGDCPNDLKLIITAYWDAESAWNSRKAVVSKKTLHAIGPDGYLRPCWNSCGTDTMRFTTRDPNVMAWEKMIRSMVGVPPGWTLIGMDKSQLEIRVVELVSADDFLWKLIQTGDVYSADAIDAFGLKMDVKSVKKLKNEARQSCKIIRLASQYQAGLPTVYAQYLAQDENVEFMHVKVLYERFHRRHANGIDRYAHDEVEFTARMGYSEGRVLHGRRYYPRPPPITEACNWPIQRTAAEMMNKETIIYWKRLRKEVPSARLIIQQHDSIVTMCRNRDAARVRSIKSECFNTEYTIGGRTRPFPVEIKEGETWSEV